MTDVKEQPHRRFPRVNATIGVLVQQQRPAQITRDRFSVLGAGGAFLETGQPYARGSILTLRFMLPEGTEEVSCQGIVRNARVGEGVGIEFLEIAQAQRDHIADFVKRHRGKR